MTKTNYLPMESYEEMANDLANVSEDLRLAMNTIEFIMNPKQVIEGSDMTVEYVKVYKYTNTLYTRLQKMVKTVDGVSRTMDNVCDLKLNDLIMNGDFSF